MLNSNILLFKGLVPIRSVDKESILNTNMQIEHFFTYSAVSQLFSRQDNGPTFLPRYATVKNKIDINSLLNKYCSQHNHKDTHHYAER